MTEQQQWHKTERALVDNPLPYPRDEHHPDFLDLSQKLHGLITQTIMPGAPAPAAEPRRPVIQALPPVSLSNTIGLLEVLENEGDMAVFELTQRVDVDLSQLLLVVTAAEMLGWVTMPAQRVQMTAEGRRFLAADINTRKQLLNAKLLEIFGFNLVIQMLQHAENGEVDEESVLCELALHFPNERPQRILRTLVGWGRYAELFKYSSTRKKFYGLRVDQAH